MRSGHICTGRRVVMREAKPQKRIDDFFSKSPAKGPARSPPAKREPEPAAKPEPDGAAAREPDGSAKREPEPAAARKPDGGDDIGLDAYVDARSGLARATRGDAEDAEHQARLREQRQRYMYQDPLPERRALLVQNFHAAALAQLNFFWPRVIGGSTPRILAAKGPAIAHAAESVRMKLDTAVLREVEGEFKARLGALEAMML